MSTDPVLEADRKRLAEEVAMLQQQLKAAVEVGVLFATRDGPRCRCVCTLGACLLLLARMHEPPPRPVDVGQKDVGTEVRVRRLRSTIATQEAIIVDTYRSLCASVDAPIPSGDRVSVVRAWVGSRACMCVCGVCMGEGFSSAAPVAKGPRALGSGPAWSTSTSTKT